MRTYEVVYSCKGVTQWKDYVSARSELHAEGVSARARPSGLHWDLIEATAMGG